MMSSSRLLPALLLAAACTETPPPAAPEWDALLNVPEGFADDTDDTRTDEEIRAAVDGLFVTAEADPMFAASPLAAVTQGQVAG